MIVLVRPKASRLLSSFYMNLGITTVLSHVATVNEDIRLVDTAFETLDLSEWEGAPPQVVLFSLYIDDFGQGISQIHLIKQRFPAIKIIVGGPHATLLGARIFEISDQIDYVAVGDCLDSAIPLITALAHSSHVDGASRVIQNTSTGTPLTAVTSDYRFWSKSRHFQVYPIEFSRGCRHHCPFCTDPVLRRGVRIDDVERVIAILKQLTNSEGEVWVRFVDSSLSSLRPDLDVLLQRIVEEKLPVRWGAYAYADEITAELASKLRLAGCVALFMGVESLSERVITGKRYARKPEIVRNAVQLLRENGIFVHCNFIVGLPGETEDTFAETLDRICWIEPDSVGGGPFYLTPGSTFHLRADRFGIKILDADWVIHQHENFYTSNYEYFRTSTLTQGQMRKLAAEFRRVVSTMPGVCWNMSDYPLICWMSVGGQMPNLKRLWNTDPSLLTPDQKMVVDVLKEKSSIDLDTVQCSNFIALARNVASSLTAND